MSRESTKKKSHKSSWYFLGIIVLIYFILYMISPTHTVLALEFSYTLALKLIPIFAFVFVFMVVVDLVLTPARIVKYIGEEAGLKKWIFIIIGGILSTGPVYVWYPLLADLQKKGVSDGLLATFLYNRAIKLQYLPLLVVYFSWLFIILMTILMIVASVAQGVFINWANKKT